MFKPVLYAAVVVLLYPASGLAVCEIQPCSEQAVDTDEDGLSDAAEQALGTSPTNPDSDYDGHTDYWEVFVGGNPLNISDRNLIPGDEDLDNDGIPDVYESYQVYFQIDTDGDGLSDAAENGFPDADNDGIVDDLTDENFNGIPDIAETGLPPLDTDRDGVPDYKDADSDQDGIYDRDEHAAPRSNPALVNPLDPDGDGLINSVDLDSDGDGIYDIDEAPLKFLREDRYLQDTDGDGKVDQLRDADTDGIPDHVDTDFVSAPFTDEDNDGIVDYAELEYLDAWQNYLQLTDAAYAPADPYLGLDSDRDGIIDEYDRDNLGAYSEVGLSPEKVDNDRDGIHAWLDANERAGLTLAAASDGGGGQWSLTGIVYLVLLLGITPVRTSTKQRSTWH